MIFLCDNHTSSGIEVRGSQAKVSLRLQSSMVARTHISQITGPLGNLPRPNSDLRPPQLPHPQERPRPNLCCRSRPRRSYYPRFALARRQPRALLPPVLNGQARSLELDHQIQHSKRLPQPYQCRDTRLDPRRWRAGICTFCCIWCRYGQAGSDRCMHRWRWRG